MLTTPRIAILYVLLIYSINSFSTGPAYFQNLDLLREADSLYQIEEFQLAYSQYLALLESKEAKLESDLVARINNQMGNCQAHLGSERIAIQHFKKVLSAKYMLDSNLLSDAYTGLGICYEYTGKHDSSMINYLQAYKMIVHTSDTMRIARGARNIAQLLRVLDRYDEAQVYCSRAIKLADGIKDYKLLANIYNETAYLFELSGVLDSAMFYYQLLYQISRDNNFQRGESVAYSNMGSVLEQQHNYEEALKIKLKAIEINKNIGDSYGLMSSYAGIKDTYEKLGQNKNALDALDRAYELCDTTWIVNLSGIYKGYYDIYKLTGNSVLALQNYEKHVQLKDRIRNTEVEERISELLTKYETEKKEQQISLLEQTNLAKRNQIRLQWLFISLLIVFVVGGLIVALLIIRNKDHKLLRMETELRSFHLLEKDSESAANDGSGSMEEIKNHDLTARETEILNLLRKGCSNAVIAEKLFVSSNTVKYHIKNIYIKLDVKSRVEALIHCNNSGPAKPV